MGLRQRSPCAGSCRPAAKDGRCCGAASPAWGWRRRACPGLNAIGLPAAQIVTVALRKHQAILWTADEALKSGALSGVILDLDPAKCTVTATRRLQLAAQARQTPAIIIMAASASLSAARSRWAVASLPSLPPPLDERAPGKPTWRVELRRCRRGKPGISQWNGIMRRIVSLWLPLFPVEQLMRARQKAGEPLLPPKRPSPWSRPGLRACALPPSTGWRSDSG